MSRSIELRLTAWYAGMLFVGFVVLAVVLWTSVRYGVRTAIDGGLRQRVELLVSTISAELTVEEGEEDEEDDALAELDEDLAEYVVGLPEGGLAQIRDEGERVVYPPGDVDPPLAWRSGAAEPQLYTDLVSDEPHRVLVQEVSIAGRRYRVLLASSLASLDEIRRRVITSLAVVTPLALLLSGGGGFLIARAALRPVDAVIETAANITVTNLSERIEVSGTGDALERLATTFNAMLERLETSVARIEQFSADASHELRTPIAVIRTTAELALRHGRAEAEYRSDLKDIQDEAERLSDLIDVLLTLSRGGQSDSIVMGNVDVKRLVADVCARFDEAVTAKGLRLERHLPERVDVVIRGNEPSLRRMLASLLENALAHTHEGMISVTVTREPSVICVRVKDTGEGVPAEALEKIFDRFYRVDTSRSRSGGRLGLGLTIARRIAELHGAELTVESRAGAGAEFIVCFKGGGA